jgi:hypothetical protein
MFVPYRFSSINEPGQLRRGTYRAQAEFFAGASTEPKLTLVSYTHWDDDEACAVDLIGIEPDGSVRIRDFLWMPDRGWRDSMGTRANHLSELLPPELQHLILVGQQRWPDIHLNEDTAP